ncbi:MAG: ABC transporter substrate-binding protein [Bacillota bacterium]|jgi:NitT/TauT family transport system substrate-binding protein
MKKLGYILLSLICLVTGSPTGLAKKPAWQKVTIGMAYIPSVQFAPWYVAKEKGFFRKAGLKVNFDYRMDIDALQLVAAGQLDYAIAGGDQVITARAQQIPVVYLATLYAKFPPAIIAKAESQITKPQDLRGKKIGLPLYGTNLLAAKVILRQAGLADSEAQLIDIGYTQIPSLTAGKVDAVVGFANNEPLKLRAAGYAVTQINSWDYFSLVGHGLITGETKLTRSPQQVRQMVRTTIAGMRYSLKHPEEAFRICCKYLPELSKKQQKMERAVLKASMQLWENTYTRKKGLGQSNPKDWEASQQLMRELGLIKRTTPVAKMLNLKFIK